MRIFGAMLLGLALSGCAASTAQPVSVRPPLIPIPTGTALFMVPILNLFAPIIGAAMATHLFHKGRTA